MNYDDQGFVVAEDGTRIFYGCRGFGPAIMLIDGIGCDGFAWTYLQPALSKDHRLVHMHYRGHGRSGTPRDPARIDVPALARDLASVMDELHIDQAVIAGHSMGTQVALELYRLAPARVRAMVLLCGSFGRVTEHFHGNDVLRQVLPTLIEAVHKRRNVARALWGRIPAGLAFRVARFGREVDGLAIREEDFRSYWDHVALMDPDLFLAMLKNAGEHSAEDMLHTVSVPTLVIAAERDTFTPAALAIRMAEEIPDAELVMLRGGSHAAPVEQPAIIEEHIRALLRRVEPKTERSTQRAP